MGSTTSSGIFNRYSLAAAPDINSDARVRNLSR